MDPLSLPGLSVCFRTGVALYQLQLYLEQHQVDRVNREVILTTAEEMGGEQLLAEQPSQLYLRRDSLRVNS